MSVVTLQTEYAFTLPRGFVDADGDLHREGVMRLATGADEIAPLRDERVKRNPAYLLIILLSRVITKLGSVPEVTPKVVESLFASDLAFLQDLYNEVNASGNGSIAAICPECEHEFEVELERLGGS
jgi:hypothetical protein